MAFYSECFSAFFYYLYVCLCLVQIGRRRVSAFKLWLSCFVPVQAMAGGCHVSALICCPKVVLASAWVGNSV